MDTDAIMREMQASFRIEAEELVVDLEETLLKLESDNTNKPLIDRAFRSVHTLKGSGSSAGFLKLAAFLHIFEDAFNLAREGKIELTQELIDLSLQTVDRITQYVEEEPSSVFDRDAVEQDPILCELKKTLPGYQAAQDATPDGKHPKSGTKHHNFYSIDFKPYENFMEFGNEPISVVDELRGHGPTIIIGTSNVPMLCNFNPEFVYLSWRLFLYSRSSYEDIEEIFSFVEMDADIKIDHSQRDIDAVSNKDLLFEPEIVSDFKSEAQSICSTFHKLALSIDEANATVDSQDFWNGLERASHTLNGSCGILLSTATKRVSSYHPIVILSHLCEAIEDLASDQAPHLQERPFLEQLSKTVQEHYLAFSLGFVPAPIEVEVLEKLRLNPELFKSDAANAGNASLNPDEEAFKNVFDQSAAMIENCLSLLNEDTLSEEFSIIERGFENIQKAARKSDKPALIKLCQQYSENCHTKKNAGASAYSAFLGPLVKELKKLESKEPLPDTKEAQQSNLASKAKTENSKSSLRVDEDKIDRLMRAVGELLVARGAFPLIAKDVADNHGLSAIAQELREAGGNVSRLADELQGAVMSIRMRSLQGLFQRFPRMIRDVSKQLGKKINFVIEGEDTELDKSMVEQLGDPLVHIIRNALDHGVETAAERAQTDKPELCTIKLGAYTEGASVAIKVQDDGRGLDPVRLKKKALEKGLITQAEADSMPDHIAQEIIMRPGFSTAESVTDLSGRGVGMDVVANNIRKLHGTIEIDSVFGEGTTFTLKLPTSLLVSEAILMKSGDEEYLIPTDSVASLEKLPLQNMRTHAGTRMMTIRGEVVNIVDLQELLSDPRKNEELPPLLNIALVQTQEGKLGIIVDKFLSQEDIVVKPLSGGLASIRLFSGVSIMGDGRVVPVINSLEVHNFYLKTANDQAKDLLNS